MMKMNLNRTLKFPVSALTMVMFASCAIAVEVEPGESTEKVASAPQPSLFAASLKNPSVLTMDAHNLYVALQGTPFDADGNWFYQDGSIVKIPKAGGSPVVLASEQLWPGGSPHSLVVDDTNVYWTVQSNPDPDYFGSVPFVLMKVSKNGGVPSVVDRNAWAYQIGVDAQHLYFVREHQLLRVKKSNGQRLVLATVTNVADLLVTSNHVYWSEYTEDFSAIHTMRVSKVGGSVVEIVPPGYGGTPLATDGSYLYFRGGGPWPGDPISRVPLMGGSVTTVVAAAAGVSSPVMGIAFHHHEVWWSAGDPFEGGPSLYRAPKSGGTAIAVESPTGYPDAPSDIVSDNHNVYWSYGAHYDPSLPPDTDFFSLGQVWKWKLP